MYKLKRLTPEIILIILIIVIISVIISKSYKDEINKIKQENKAIVIDITKDSLSIDSVKNNYEDK